MSKRIFTSEQLRELRSNKYVRKCSKKSVSFTSDFKILAVSLYKQGLALSEVFRRAGFDLSTIGKETPKACLKRWRKLVKNKGESGLSECRGKGGNGGRPKIKGLTDADKIERLEVQVAYLKAENAFLAKLRAKQKE